MKEKYMFYADDKNKSFGIKEFFEYSLNNNGEIKSTGIVTDECYLFKTFNISNDHVRYIYENIEESGIFNYEVDPCIEFSCDGRDNRFTINFMKENDNGGNSLFIGQCILEILAEYRKFLLENKEEINSKHIKLELDLGNNYYRNNKTGDFSRNMEIDEFIRTLDECMLSMYVELNELIDEKKYGSKEEVSIFKMVKSLFKKSK